MSCFERLLTRCFSHLGLVIFVLLHDAIAAPGFNTICLAVCWLLGYLQHLLVGGGWVDLTARRLKLLSYFLHGMLLMIQISEAATTANAPVSGPVDLCHFAFMEGLYTTIRFWLIFAFLDPGTSVPFQLLFTITNALTYLVVFGSKVPVGPLACKGHGPWDQTDLGKNLQRHSGSKGLGIENASTPSRTCSCDNACAHFTSTKTSLDKKP